jgi:xanthine dehydrogenase/oxidase
MASPDYRRSLALSLFYKFILYVNQNKISPRNQSALTSIIDSRPLSTGTQSFPTQPSNYPLTQPIPKLNSKLQVNYQLYISNVI